MSHIQHKQARPGNRTDDDSRLKLHLRVLSLNGKIWRVLTLRPGTDVAFSTNYFHETWHLVSDEPGARLLAHLFWGMSYQREPRTLFLMHGENIRATPFEAEPSQPFAICPANVTAPDPQAFREMKRLLPRLPPPTATVRLQTWGLDEMVATDDWEERQQRAGLDDGNCTFLWERERMTLEGGVICYTALPIILRAQADVIARMRICRIIGQEHHELAANHAGRWGGMGDGEVQIFRRYREMLSEANEARREVARNSGDDSSALQTKIVREAVWEQAYAVEERRRDALLARRRQPR